MTKLEILQEARMLPPEEQLEVAQALWDQNTPDPGFVLSPALKRELERRLAEATAHPETSIPWEEAKRKYWPDL